MLRFVLLTLTINEPLTDTQDICGRNYLYHESFLFALEEALLVVKCVFIEMLV